MRSDDRRGAFVIVAWFLGAVALLAVAGLLGWWYFSGTSRRLGQHLPAA